jgi:hypothetical protein
MADLRRPPCRIARSEPAGQILILNVSKVPSISPTGAPALGHKRAFACQESRVANDRFQSTAVVGRRPIVVPKSPNRSFIAFRCNPALRIDVVSAGQGIELALPTQLSYMSCNSVPRSRPSTTRTELAEGHDPVAAPASPVSA